MVIGIAFELGGGLEPVEVAAEGLDSVEFADDGQSSFVVYYVCRVGGGVGRAGGIARGRCVWHVRFSIMVYCPSN